MTGWRESLWRTHTTGDRSLESDVAVDRRSGLCLPFPKSKPPQQRNNRILFLGAWAHENLNHGRDETETTEHRRNKDRY